MTVSISFSYDIRPYTGYADPSLPIGAWIAQGGVAGNAGGGSVIMDFLFQTSEAGQQRITELYSLEQISIDTSAGANENVIMQTLNMDTLSRNRAASPQKWRVGTQSTGSDSALNLQDASNSLPLWLGSPNIDALSGDGGLRFTFSVNTDLRLYAITVQGYLWGARSILAEGGPRRPVGGLFKA